MLRAEQAQTTHTNRAGGCAVTVEITDDQDALVGGDGLNQQVHGRIDSGQQLRRVQVAELGQRQLRGVRTTRGIQACQQR
ncbi:hypothetical protein D3C81_807450 [compost metagenome]